MSSVFFISMMNGAPWGGSEELWYSSAMHAARKGHKVAVAVYHWQEKEIRMKRLAEAGCKIFYLPNKGRRKRNINERVQNKITKWFRIKKALKALPVEDYHMVIMNQGYFEVTSPVWQHFYQRLQKYILLFHNYNENEKIKPKKAEILRSWIQHASLNLFASGRIRIVLEEQLSSTINNAALLLNPISFNPPAGTTPSPPLYNGNFRMVMLATLDIKRKAQDQLIIALSSKRWREKNWTLHLYGEGKDEKLLRKLIKRNGMSDKIFIEGHVTDVEKILREAHILFQVTHIDAMPLSVVEALAMSRPVVASKIGDMPDWVIFNENGWICHHSTAQEIDRIMHLVWAGRDNWKEMGIQSYKIFRQKYPDSPAEYFLSQAGI